MKSINHKCFYKMLALLTVAALSNACVKMTDANDESESSAEAIPARVSPSNIQVLGPNQFQVVLPISPSAEFLQRENLKTHAIERIQFRVENGSVVDNTVVAGEPYAYYVGNSASPNKVLEVSIPKDLILSENVILTAPTQWKGYFRVFINRGVEVYINGFDLTIEARELISEGGSFQTFYPDLRASEGRAGRRGGTINMKFESAQGFLKMQMRGEHGGHAVAIKDIKGGAGGNSGYFLIRVQNPSVLRLDVSVQKGLGGDRSEFTIPPMVQGAPANYLVMPAGSPGVAEQSCYQQSSQLTCY